MIPLKGLKERVKEFLQQGSPDIKTLVDFSEQVIEVQDKITITAHKNEEGAIDCMCLGSLCSIEHVPTEEMLGCKRLHMMFLDEAEEEENFVPRPDHFQV